MLGTCDSVHQKWCNTSCMLAREIPFPSYKNRVDVSEYVLGGYSFTSVLSRLMASDEKPSVKAKLFA